MYSAWSSKVAWDMLLICLANQPMPFYLPAQSSPRKAPYHWRHLWSIVVELLVLEWLLSRRYPIAGTFHESYRLHLYILYSYAIGIVKIFVLQMTVF